MNKNKKLFKNTEKNSANNLDVNRIKCNKSWDELLSIINEVIATPDICKTLIIDTADWTEVLCINAVCDKYRVASIEAINYGKGYVYVSEEFNKLLSLLDKLVSKGINFK